MEETQNNIEQVFEGYSKVKIVKNSKGVNIEVTASGRDFSSLDAIKTKAIQIFKEADVELNQIA
jgi:hypothetical protein